MVTPQEILVDNATYPTAEIGANAQSFRELGLGYANLGALLMSLGLPYDSEGGRAYAAAVTALMSGEGYLQSARADADNRHGRTGHRGLAARATEGGRTPAAPLQSPPTPGEMAEWPKAPDC